MNEDIATNTKRNNGLDVTTADNEGNTFVPISTKSVTSGTDDDDDDELMSTDLSLLLLSILPECLLAVRGMGFFARVVVIVVTRPSPVVR